MANAEHIKLDDGTVLDVVDADGRDMISDAFSSSDTYAVGDTAIYNNELYVCKTAISTPGAWDSTKWERKNLGEYASQLKSSLVDKINFDSETTTQMYNAITSSGGSLVNLTSTATATLTNNATSGVSVGYFKKSTSGHVGFSIVNYVSLSTWTGRITSSGTVEYLDRLASKSSVTNLETVDSLLSTSIAVNSSTTTNTGTLTKSIADYRLIILEIQPTMASQKVFYPYIGNNVSLQGNIIQSMSVYAMGNITINNKDVTVQFNACAGWNDFKLKQVYGFGKIN